MWRSKPYPRKPVNRLAPSISRPSAHRAAWAFIGTVILTTGHAAAETSEVEGYPAEAPTEYATVLVQIEEFIDRLSDQIQRDTEKTVLNRFEERWPFESILSTRQVVIVQAKDSRGSTSLLVNSLTQPQTMEGPAPPPAALADERFFP